MQSKMSFTVFETVTPFQSMQIWTVVNTKNDYSFVWLNSNQNKHN